MPVRRLVSRRSRLRGGRRRMRGAGFMDFVKKANSFLRDNKVISTIGNALGSIGVPMASNIAGVAGKLGYGRKRRGGALRLAGMGLNPAGGMRRRVSRRR